MTAYPIAGWPVALVPPAVQSVNGDAQHFRDIRQRHQLVTGLQRHDHLLSWRRLVNPGHWRGRSIQPCLRPDRLAAVHSPTCVSPNIEDLSIDKPLSHEAAACGREDRHRTGGAGHIGLGKALCSSGWPRFLSTLRPRSTVGESSTSRTERELSPWTCA
jgi:hypothetical protein